MPRPEADRNEGMTLRLHDPVSAATQHRENT